MMAAMGAAVDLDLGFAVYRENRVDPDRDFDASSMFAGMQAAR
jgi:hypothetical protein